MGFRDPVTSVPGVDTGDGGATGVRLYNLNTVAGGAAYATGVAEWYTPYGLGSLRMSVNASADGSTTQGAQTTLAGIGDFHRAGPVMHMDVVESAVSGYDTRAGWTGADYVDLGGADLRNVRKPDLIPVAAFGGWDVPAGSLFGGWRDAQKLVHLRGWLRNLSAFQPTGSGAEILCVLPPELCPIGNPIPFPLIPVSVSSTLGIQVNIQANGQVTIARPYAATIGAGAVWNFHGITYE